MTDKTNAAELLAQLNAGIFMQKIEAALSQVALGVALEGKRGKVSVTFQLDRIGESTQVEMKHTLKYLKPTARGEVVESDCTSTPLHVGAGGVLSPIPVTGDMFSPENRN